MAVVGRSSGCRDQHLSMQAAIDWWWESSLDSHEHGLCSWDKRHVGISGTKRRDRPFCRVIYQHCILGENWKPSKWEEDAPRASKTKMRALGVLIFRRDGSLDAGAEAVAVAICLFELDPSSRSLFHVCYEFNSLLSESSGHHQDISIYTRVLRCLWVYMLLDVSCV